MTSRLSYTSAAESDGEFCGEDTPRRSAEINNIRAATSQDPSNRLVRATSDPSLARQDGTIKSEPGDHIPDYSLPPPYSTQPEVTNTYRQECRKLQKNISISDSTGNSNKKTVARRG